MPQQQQTERRLSGRYSWIALTLATIAGAVDGIGYVLLRHIFTSHMSGNTVALTIYIADGRWREAWRHGEPIAVFFVAIVAGLVLTDLLQDTGVARMFSAVASCEVALLVAFLVFAHPPREWMVVFPAGAMGIQNAMLRRVGHHRVRTTFITGMITNAAQGLVDCVRALAGREDGAAAHFRDCLFYGGIWVLFAGGGIAGALLVLSAGASALWLPIGMLLVLIAFDVTRPMATSAP